MILTNPFCHGENARRRHPLTAMRVEVQSEGALPMLRCPECHDLRPYSTTERLDELPMRDECAVIVRAETVERAAEWTRPFRLRFVKTDHPRIVSLEVCRQ